MKEFIWLPLRLDFLPVLHKQAHALLHNFLEARTQIMEGDILALQSVTTLRERIQERCKEIDLFYAANAKDPRTRYLYSVKAVLQQILQGCQEFDKFLADSQEDILTNREEQNPTRFKRSASSSPKSSRSKSPSFKSKGKPGKKSAALGVSKRLFQLSKPGSNIPSSNKPSSKPPPTEQREKSELRLSDLRRPPTSKSKTPRKNQSALYNEKPPKGSSRKVEGGQTKRMQEQNLALKRLQEEKQESMERMRDAEGAISKSMRDLSELVFTIKMTKEEYNEFMKLKRSNNHA